MSELTEVTCHRHPKQVTRLTCGKCGIPICPDCAVLTSVGYKCKECGTYKNTQLFSISPRQAIAGAAVGILAGLLAGFILPVLGFFTIWLALPYGRFAGMLIQRVSGHKIGLKMEILTAASIIIGYLGARFNGALIYMQQINHTVITTTPHMPVVATPPPAASLVPFIMMSGGIYGLIGIVLVVAVAVSTFRWVWKF